MFKELFEEETVINETFDVSDIIDELLEKLGKISPQARDDVLYALLYGFSKHNPARPPLAAIRRFAQKMLRAEPAERIHTDRLDPDTEQVQTAAWKVIREFDRLRGLLRFVPEHEQGTPQNDPDPCYTARCTPDHFVLPLLADHFLQRFGKTSWAIIDEKRNLALWSKKGKAPSLCRIDPEEWKSGTIQNAADEWENLWKNYHHSINNEDRANPHLQKQFMPRRYWKYLPEVK
ncbi:MAG: TIGR03915 family putative DNA repair protein [Treponema sp.]|nr:TIGR03915 family putative DNA repair protein [Treponema sp.]